MDYRNFGRAGLKVSPISLGTSFRIRSDDDIHAATIQRAIDLGINVIDCSNSYLQTHAERIVGQVLKEQRDRVVLTGKVCSPTGDGPNDRGPSRAHIMREIENSLTGFQTDHIDIYCSIDPIRPPLSKRRCRDLADLCVIDMKKRKARIL